MKRLYPAVILSLSLTGYACSDAAPDETAGSFAVEPTVSSNVPAPANVEPAPAAAPIVGEPSGVMPAPANPAVTPPNPAVNPAPTPAVPPDAVTPAPQNMPPAAGPVPGTAPPASEPAGPVVGAPDPAATDAPPMNEPSPPAPAEPSGPVVLFAVNAGGPGFVAQDGTEFVGDHFFTGGTMASTTRQVTGTSDQMIYQSERWGEFTYEFPVAAGSYDVTLFLAETHFGAANAGNRVMSVSAEGQPVVENYDPLVAVGEGVADSIEVTGIQVADGALTLSFSASVDEAMIKGLLVKGAAGSAGMIDPNAPIGTLGDPALLPDGCASLSPVAETDFVLFDGAALDAPMGNTLSLHGGWVLDEVWAVPQGAMLGVAATGNGSAITYRNGGPETGFKFTPPVSFGVRQTFRLTGVDLYIEGSMGTPVFGLRVIKPGEFEGNGFAPTTTWTRDAGGQQDLTLGQGCNLYPLTMPQDWTPTDVANRFILEVKNGWTPANELRVRRIVIKGYSVAQ